MNKTSTFLFLSFLLLSVSLQAQNHTISGYVRDASTGEDLIGANVVVVELLKGAMTNNYGFYSLTVPGGVYTVKVSFIGYADKIQTIDLTKNVQFTVKIEPTDVTTEEVVVTAQGSDKNVQSVDMGVVELPIKQIKELPAFFGEVDILKTIQLLPGVQSGGEGSSGFYVRGGGPDQNLILLDEAPVYNASHLFGFFSVFNADAIKSVELTKGGMPANYGGRLSSVLNISMKEGNNQTFHASGGIGLISSRLTLEGPIVKDKSSFIVSARRTYIDVLLQPFVPKTSDFKGVGYYFYDLNAKVNYRFSDKDRVFLSAYYGRDRFSVSNDGFGLAIPWGNGAATARWNHLFTDKVFMNMSFIVSDYQFQFEALQDNFELKLFSGIRDYSSKLDFTWLPSYKHTVKFGTEAVSHTFIPSTVSAAIGQTQIDPDQVVRQYARDYAIYLNDEYEVNEWLKVNAGLRGTLFQQMGPYYRFIKDPLGNTSDTIKYEKGDVIAVYKNIEPRLALRISLGKTTSFKAAYTQNYQYIHLATLSSASLPTDLWVPSSTVVKPQFGTQYSVGLFKNFKDNMFETSVELYYKHMDNQIEYKDGATPGSEIGDNTDNYFTFGQGESYGMELFFKKGYGKFTGWIGYTLSKTTRTFPEINYGETYPAKYDRRHDVSLIVSYKLNPKWSFSSVFVYATGNTLTLPTARYVVESQIISEYGMRNSFRMSSYHRLDFSATYSFQIRRKYNSSLNFSVYNAYNRANPYFIYFETKGSIEDASLTTTAKQVSLFPVLPSIAWNFEF